jgi:hypothetical protein
MKRVSPETPSPGVHRGVHLLPRVFGRAPSLPQTPHSLASRFRHLPAPLYTRGYLRPRRCPSGGTELGTAPGEDSEVRAQEAQAGTRQEKPARTRSGSAGLRRDPARTRRELHGNRVMAPCASKERPCGENVEETRSPTEDAIDEIRAKVGPERRAHE